MWDQLGNEPSPSINEAKSEIKLSPFKKYNISDKSLNEIIDKVLHQDEVKKMLEASLAAWYNFTRDEIIKKCIERFKKILWNNTVEEIYSPDSIFVQECCQKYENILQGNKILPPLPPS